MSAQPATIVTRDHIDAAFKALGRLEGLAGPIPGNNDLGDTIAQVLHFASSTLRRKQVASQGRKSRRASERAYREAQTRRHEEEQLGATLIAERLDDLSWSEVGLAAD